MLSGLYSSYRHLPQITQAQGASLDLDCDTTPRNGPDRKEDHTPVKTRAQPNAADVAKMIAYANTHFKAGRGLDDPRLRRDLITLEYNLGVVLDPYRPTATNTQRSQYLVGWSRRTDIALEKLMARLDPISTALDNISTQLAQLATQIAALSADDVTQEEIDAVAAKAQAIADAVDATIETAGEDDVAEPPPVE